MQEENVLDLSQKINELPFYTSKKTDNWVSDS